MARERRIPGQDSIFLRGIQTRLNEVPGLGQTDSGTGSKALDDVVLCPSSPPHNSQFPSPDHSFIHRGASPLAWKIPAKAGIQEK